MDRECVLQACGGGSQPNVALNNNRWFPYGFSPPPALQRSVASVTSVDLQTVQSKNQVWVAATLVHTDGVQSVTLLTWRDGGWEQAFFFESTPASASKLVTVSIALKPDSGAPNIAFCNDAPGGLAQGNITVFSVDPDTLQLDSLLADDIQRSECRATPDGVAPGSSALDETCNNALLVSPCACAGDNAISGACAPRLLWTPRSKLLMGYVQPFGTGSTIGVSQYLGPSAPGGSWRPFPTLSTLIPFSLEPILSRPAMALEPGYECLYVAVLHVVYDQPTPSSELAVVQFTCDDDQFAEPGNVCF